jgi:hypothetical protein
MVDHIVVLSNHQLFQSSLGDDDSWEGDSFLGGSFSEASFDDATEKRLQVTEYCINDALAVLTSPGEEDKAQISALPEIFSALPLRSDSPPARPCRSFDVGLTHSKIPHSQSNYSHDRFQLSKSEHMSRSFRAPELPNRLSESNKAENGNASGSADASNSRCHPSEDDKSDRDTSVRPPIRARSLKTSRSSRGIFSGLQHDSSEHGQVILRALDDRCLVGTRELSTSHHLRRSCPSRGD